MRIKDAIILALLAGYVIGCVMFSTILLVMEAPEHPLVTAYVERLEA